MGSQGMSERHVMGMAEKLLATFPAQAGLPETSGTAWELPLRATITLLLIYCQVSLLICMCTLTCCLLISPATEQ